MAIVLDPSTARIVWKTQGASAACTVGSQYALLHCNKNVNRAAGDKAKADDVPTGDAIILSADVFLEPTAGERDPGERLFGMVQVTELFSYEFLYAGRVASEGSCVMNLKSGFTNNPSLSSSPPTSNAQHTQAGDAIFELSKSPMLTQGATRPEDLPKGFFR